MITPRDAASYTVTDALFDLTLDNLEALAAALKDRGMVLRKSKADRIIEILNQCLGGQDERDESSAV